MTTKAEAGATIGGYRLVRPLGRGGMAEVWLAQRMGKKRPGKAVAIKLIADHYVGDPAYARMFRVEAELSVLLSHANIVQVFDEGEDDGRSYLVMEWVDGINLLKLRELLVLVEDDTRFRIIAYVTGQLLHALSYAHRITTHEGNPLGIVHRDVTPQNVMVSNNGEVKLMDFGVAHNLTEESSGEHVRGKIRYMAPEQLAGKTRDPRLDLYAVGAILHELLDGKRFRGTVDDQRVLIGKILTGANPPLERPCPPALDELRLALLQPDPDRRVATAADAIAMLRRFGGYTDMRLELAELCSRLTGVLTPRTGPGRSRASPAAVPVVAAPTPPPTPEPERAAAPAPTPEDKSVETDAPVLRRRPRAGSPGDPEGRPRLTVLQTPAVGAASDPLEATLQLDAPRPTSNAAANRPEPHRGDDRVVPTPSPAPTAPEVATRTWPGMQPPPLDARSPDEGGSRRSGAAFWAMLAAGSLALGGAAAFAWVALGNTEEAEIAHDAAPAAAVAGPGTPEDPSEVEDPQPPEDPTPVTPQFPDVEADTEAGEPAETSGPAETTAPAEPEPTPDADPAPATSSPPPTARPEPASTKPRPEKSEKTVEVPVHARLAGIEAGYLKLGRRTLKVTPFADVKIATGTYRIKWRTDPSAPWKSGPKVVIGEGSEWLLKIGPAGVDAKDMNR
jgi:serine/threonine protein kinase